ncbi:MULTISPECIES: S1 domain-containing RNA-binding protein [Fictibacillus]|uniref:S1 domain-containing RNA-binding protein n=1 Tax=Fictibacillus terranigra TaxID=3058424 RepID=A0ABT8EEB2_9BACL|nr:S1 domain-containing RNA-binding protein [Fictibacillus sp. CENA-BCM004]MDN4076256.1 S1 domain-containing RNA-binding protein [Fictibacillus sp. CENA-BCM004]
MSIEVGSKLQGKVTGITHFGAFVELPGGTTGLVHISEVADNYVKDINDHLKVGDEVEVKVMNIEKDGKIGLSIKKAKDNPAPMRNSYGANKGNFGAPKSGGFGPSKGGFNKQRKGSPRGNGGFNTAVTFEDKMSKFLKDSEDRLATLKRQTESKRGGRGARRG